MHTQSRLTILLAIIAIGYLLLPLTSAPPQKSRMVKVAAV
jgi:hypothetical protein